MDKKSLADFFSQFWKIPSTKIRDSLVLDGSSLKDFSSIKLYQFFADIESKFDVKLVNINEILTFKDLCENISPRLRS